MSELSIALVHHPVRGRDGGEITTAITNLDVHDLARTACTYGVARYYVVTPIAAQRELVHEIVRHWREGAGRERIPDRSRAMGLVETAPSLEAAVSAIEARRGARPRVLATAARAGRWTLARLDDEARALCERDVLVVFGTGHGLTDEILTACDAVLPPIRPSGDYNHLSVRAAAAVMLDRLVGDRS
jgi:hypothetical protein